MRLTRQTKIDLENLAALLIVGLFLLAVVIASALLILNRPLEAQTATAGRNLFLATAAEGRAYNSVGLTEDEHAVKATRGQLLSIHATNTNAAARYLRCGNAAIATNIPGTTAPILDLAVPAAVTGGALAVEFPHGLHFTTALTCWIVVGAATTDVAEAAANEVKVVYTFK